MSSPSGGDGREIYHSMMRFGNYPWLILDSRVVDARMVYTDDIPFHDP